MLELELFEYYKGALMVVGCILATALPTYLTIRIDQMIHLKKEKKDNPMIQDWVLKNRYDFSYTALIVMFLIFIFISCPSLILLNQYFNS